MAGLVSLFTTFAAFNPLQIKGALNTLTSAALLKGNGSFSIQTDSFSLESKTLTSDPLVLPRLTLPSLGLPPGSFASTIQWEKNPYDDSTNPVVSISALSRSAVEIPIRSLSTPFTTRWPIHPQKYTFFCDRGIVLLDKGTYTSAPNVTRISPLTWSVPCGPSFTNVSCPIDSFSCPTPECVYWNTSRSAWSSDGCVKEITGNTLLCHCTHMTDFSVRLQGIATDTSKVLGMANSVYSEEGLVLYAKWYGIFGAIALFAIFLFTLATWLDFPIRKLYVDYLMRHPKLKPLLNRAPLTPMYRFNRASTLQMYRQLHGEKPEATENRKPQLNVCRRMCIQHTYVQSLLRFDPRLSRSFRVLFLILMQVHSLFVTALFYGFSFASKKDLDIGDTILLSLLTCLVTIPCMRIALYYLNTVGLLEFKYQFPMLYDEYMRRVKFEELASPLFPTSKGPAEEFTTDGTEEGMILKCIHWLMPQEEIVPEEVKVDRPAILKQLAKSVKEEYPKFTTYSFLWDILPCHTLPGWLFLLSCFAWIGWCLQYLLLFAAAHPSSVGDDILTSYGSSELITLFITQPLSILFSTVFFVLVNKYKGELPWPLSRLGSVDTKHSIPSMYYFSNPLNHHTYTILSSEFAHILFLEAPSAASKIDLFSAAPIKSILSSINDVEEVPDRRIEDLYVSMVNYYIQQV